MKDFDLKKIGKEMPYKAPDNDFFENFTEELLSKVSEKQPTKVFSLKRVITPIISIAAAIAIILTVGFDLSDDTQKEQESLLLSESIDDSLDSFFASLSDEELAYLAVDSSYQDDFYVNLPTD